MGLDVKQHKTSFHICGFWHHVTWNGNEGADQHGRKWFNPNNPTTDSAYIDKVLDTYNNINN